MSKLTKAEQQQAKNAAAYILKNGWQQGAYGLRNDGPACMVGALAYGNGKASGWQAPSVSDRLAVALIGEGMSLASLNDVVGRTKEDIIGILDQVANVPDALG